MIIITPLFWWKCKCRGGWEVGKTLMRFWDFFLQILWNEVNLLFLRRQHRSRRGKLIFSQQMKLLGFLSDRGRSRVQFYSQGNTHNVKGCMKSMPFAKFVQTEGKHFWNIRALRKQIIWYFCFIYEQRKFNTSRVVDAECNPRVMAGSWSLPKTVNSGVEIWYTRVVFLSRRESLPGRCRPGIDWCCARGKNCLLWSHC